MWITNPGVKSQKPAPNIRFQTLPSEILLSARDPPSGRDGSGGERGGAFVVLVSVNVERLFFLYLMSSRVRRVHHKVNHISDIFKAFPAAPPSVRSSFSPLNK